MNIVQIQGRLGKDAVLSTNEKGDSYCKISIATGVSVKGKKETLWWNVVIPSYKMNEKFRQETLPQLKKGSEVNIVGDMGLPIVFPGSGGENRVGLSVFAQTVKLIGEERKESPKENHKVFKESPTFDQTYLPF